MMTIQKPVMVNRVTCNTLELVSVDRRNKHDKELLSSHSTMRLTSDASTSSKSLQIYELPKIMKTHQYLWKNGYRGKMIRYILSKTILRI
ncbi:hypothetical protein FQN60_002225 [Etheostoma spectabile]|uniref:Uncharacterized protein n=1 Tax=Etheostoma spectabile TaxID=54343 RepID=A0A5J5D9D6_9PERO|nr:hypothetical protein FQN60_002225 [Etheostoma spectabile]